jgi:chondroitin 4-sulfotransferase 11
MNAVFIRPPKVAGASIETALGVQQYAKIDRVMDDFRQEGFASFGHMDYALLVEEGYVNKEFDDTAYKFAFVRNPYDRAVSWFFFSRVRGTVPLSTTFIQFVRELCEPLMPIGLYNGTPWVSGGLGPSKYNPQIRWLENVSLDFLGRYETLHTDTAVVAEALNIDLPDLGIVHYSDHGPYEEYYCDESRALVGKAYQEDFEQFDYSPYLGGGYESDAFGV